MIGRIFRKTALILMVFVLFAASEVFSFDGHLEKFNGHREKFHHPDKHYPNEHPKKIHHAHRQRKRTHQNVLLTMPSGALSEEEKEALLYMREEEKLARDVYLTLYQRYGLMILANISESEQNHMDRVKMLIDRYGLEDPVKNEEEIGSFTNPQMAALYNDLVERGSTSEIEALKVGALIEDLDIHDLEEKLALTDKEDLQIVFKNLKSGSHNHLRAFVRALSAYGESYTPQYISQEEFEEIVGDVSHPSRRNGMIQLPAEEHHCQGEEKANFTFVPAIPVREEDRGMEAEMYALIYFREGKRWFLVSGENQVTPWSPGMELVPLARIKLGKAVRFPLITRPLNLNDLQGTFDVYFGYRPEGGPLVYTLRSLIFE